MADAPILYDDRIKSHYTVWHDDPNLEALVLDLMGRLRPDRFVETGTHMAWTLMWMAERYPDLPIYSAEIDRDYWRISLHNTARFQNVHLYRMDSPAFLRDIFPIMSRGLNLFWLDAHWWPMNSEKGMTPTPLRAECEIVEELESYACLVDDFACRDPDFQGDVFDGQENNLRYLSDIMGPSCWRPSYRSLPPYNKGYGLFLKGVDYVPPPTMREDSFLRGVET